MCRYWILQQRVSHYLLRPHRCWMPTVSFQAQYKWPFHTWNDPPWLCKLPLINSTTANAQCIIVTVHTMDHPILIPLFSWKHAEPGFTRWLDWSWTKMPHHLVPLNGRSSASFTYSHLWAFVIGTISWVKDAQFPDNIFSHFPLLLCRTCQRQLGRTSWTRPPFH